MDVEDTSGGGERPGGAGPLLTRRALLQKGAALGVAASTLGALELLAITPRRAAAATSPSLPEIQFAIEKFTPRAFSVEGVSVRLGPVYTMFATIALTRESAYPFTPAGVFLSIAYGVPYFERLPGGLPGALVSAHMPRLAADPQRFAFEEAVPGPTDVAPANPGIVKRRFDVPVQIEANDLLLTLRSDSTAVIADVLDWLTGAGSTLHGNTVGESGLGGLLSITSRRLIFNQQGLPRKVADEHALPYAESINPQSLMWMGFADQQVGSSGSPTITTFLGNSIARLTTARGGDYFDHGSVVHLSHVIEDLEQFYARPQEPYINRVSYMFRSEPPPRPGRGDQFTNGGGPSFVDNRFGSPQDAASEATGAGTFDKQPRVGHTTALQRSSRAVNRMPVHIRVDGPGFDALDVPDGSPQPKLHFSIHVPTAEFFRTMRRNQASLDLAQQNNIPAANLGIERFITTTRRQNFLVPPRRHRAFPLVEVS